MERFRMIEKIQGLITAPLTPFDKDGTVNLDAIADYAKFLQRNGVVGAFVNGTTGLGHLLGMQERMDIAKRWVTVAPKGFKIIIHVGHTSIVETKTLAKHAQDIGATGIAAMAPLFLRPSTVEALVTHCAQEAVAAPNLPYYYYHIPRVSGVDLPMLDFLRLAKGKIPNLAGLKFSKVDPYEYALCLDFEGGKYDLLWGSDENFLPAMAVGARGAVGSTYSFAAPIFNNIIKEFLAGHQKEAQQYALTSMKMVDAILRTGNLNGSIYAIMRWLGFEYGAPRTPVPELGGEQQKSLRIQLEKLGFFEFCSK